MNSLFKNSVSLFFLTAFLLLRVANVHEVYHVFSDEEAQHCEQCTLIAHTNQGTPLDASVPSSDVFIENTLHFEVKNKFTLYTVPYRTVLHSDYFHNKPPPSYSLG